jgi:hypothetical protein
MALYQESIEENRVRTDKRRLNICCKDQKDVRINVLNSFFTDKIVNNDLVFRILKEL